MRGQFDQDTQEEPIHILEYEAVFKALFELGDHIRDTCVRLWVDNSVVVAGLRKQYSSKPAIQVQLKKIFSLLREHNASIIAQWIPSKENVPADTLSRVNVGDAYQLNPNIFKKLNEFVDNTMSIDRFATSANALLPCFNSYFHEEGCDGVDAFA